jgi:hypothetical protein
MKAHKKRRIHPLGKKIGVVLLIKLVLIITIIWYIAPYKRKPSPYQVAQKLLGGKGVKINREMIDS